MATGLLLAGLDFRYMGVDGLGYCHLGLDHVFVAGPFCALEDVL